VEVRLLSLAISISFFKVKDGGIQTSREVIDNLLRGGKAERVGLYDRPWDDTIKKWVDEGDYPTNEDGGPVDTAVHFGFDMVGAAGWFDHLPIRGFSQVEEETDQWEIKRNGAGAALKFWKHKSGTPEHIDFRMTSREVWEKDYRHHLLEPDRKRIDVDGAKKAFAQRREQQKWAFYGHMFIMETMRQSIGDVCLCESVLLAPEWILDYGRVYTDFFKAHYKLLFDQSGLPDGIWVYEDIAYKNGLFVSPKILRELFFPYYKELVGFFHSYDLPVVLHSCGNITEALDLIVEAGFDGLNPLEAKAGCEPIRIAEKYGDKLAFVGGLDERVLESGDKQLIKKAVTELVEGMKKIGARYIFGSDHSVSTNVTYESYRYAIEVYREHMIY
jgi:uroporphyrinogen decarboxylase